MLADVRSTETKQPSPSPPSLCECPLELLTFILEELEWRDVLQARRVCKVLHEVSKMRSVWLKFCVGYLTPTATRPQVLHLERPFKLYQSHELESLFLRMKGAELGWKTNDRPPSRKRDFVTARIPKCVYLVEGGRWLLVAPPTGSITYFDLDASTPIERVLIPDQFDVLSSETSVTMAIDRDNACPFLAFNLAVSFCAAFTPTPEPKGHQVQIWKISLVLDEQQQGTGLAAEPLASFPQQLRVNRIYNLSLLGSFLALSVLCSGYASTSNPKRAIIIDWEQANGNSTEYPMRLLPLTENGDGPTSTHLLPGKRVLAAAYQVLMIFDYKSIKEIWSMPPFGHSDTTAVPLWEERTLGLRETTLSRPFFCSDSIRFSIRGHGYLFGVVFNHPYEEAATMDLPQVVNLFEFPPISRVAEHPVYGYNKIAILEGCDDTHLFSYLWPDEEGHQFLPIWSHKDSTAQTCISGPFMDEESGRVVVPAANSRSHDIWDFSPSTIMHE